MKRRIGSLLVLLAPVLVAGCDGSGSSGGGSSPQRRAAALATHPVLPATWTLTDFPGQNGTQRPIRWRRTRRGGAIDVPHCARGRAALRVWTEGGGWFQRPRVFEVLCFRDDERAARGAYRSQSLESVAGSHWPNFEPFAKARIYPKGVASLESLRADQWEIGCVAGNPDGICAAWVFRARYVFVLAVIEFDTSAGGIRFSAMRRLVRSIDRETSAAQHSN